MSDMEALQRLCDDTRTSIGSPFSFDFDGQHFYGATDGHAMTVVVATGERLREDGPPAPRLLSRSEATHSVDLAALSEWLDGCTWEKQCEACKGTKYHRCNCRYCEVMEDEECDDCDGSGVQKVRDWVKFGKVCFDRALMARYFEPLRSRCVGTGEAVFTDDELAPFEVRGDGWRVVVMPGRLTEDEERRAVPDGVFTPCR